MTPSERADLLERIHDNAALNGRERGRKATYGPMICLCPDTDADPLIQWGTCSKCGRKPLALFGVAS